MKSWLQHGRNVVMALVIMQQNAFAGTLTMDGLTFTTGGTREWKSTTAVTYDGNGSLESGGISHNSSTSLALDVSETTEVVLSFYWKVSSEKNYDVLTWSVDGVEQKTISGEVDWELQTIKLSAGAHTIKWIYSTDEDEDDGEDCGWVDAVKIERPNTFVVKSVEAQPHCPSDGQIDIVVAFEGNADQMDKVDCLFLATNSTTEAELKIASISKIGPDSVTGDTCIRNFRWNAAADLGEIKIEGLAITVNLMLTVVDKTSGGVQLWKDGPYWAECNLGATTPEECGYYFWWGDTVGYARSGGTWSFGWYYNNVTWTSSDGVKVNSSPFNQSKCPTYGKNDESLKSLGYVDSSGNLAADHDAATVHLGAPWRMPTYAEVNALTKNCTATWTQRDGVYGQLVTGKGEFESESIFLPLTGRAADFCLYYPHEQGEYWSSSLHPDCSHQNYACDLCILHGSGGFSSYSCVWADRYYGIPIRPIRSLIQKNTFRGKTAHVKVDFRVTPEFIAVSNTTEGVTLVWTNVAWATAYNIYRATNDIKSTTPLATLIAGVTNSYCDTMGTVGTPYWYWIEAVDGTTDALVCESPISGVKLKQIVISNISYEGLRGTSHTNPATYQEETAFMFTPPTGTVPGYTFAGWSPNGISVDMTGNQVVTANWAANSYSIVFHANGGQGEMANQAFVYDEAQTLTACVFTRDGYSFVGWAAYGDASSTDWANSAVVSNLTVTADGVVELWAVWNELDPIPDLGENPTTEAITNVFVEANAGDPKLAEKITNETEYVAFREWSGKVQPHGGGDAVGAAGVMAAPNAWMSYALGSETLLEAAPTDADLTVEAFEPKSGEDGKFDFTISVEGVDVGGAATTEAQKEQVKENLKQVFGLEGGTTLDPGGMSSANVDITFGTPQDGKVKFTAGPKDTGAKTFFMKVKVK